MPIVLVQQAGNDVVDASVPATFGSAVTAGNVVVAMAAIHNSGDLTIASVTGLTGATWASVRDSSVTAQSHKAIWVGSGFTGGTVVTMTPSSGTLRMGLTVAEFSGLTTTTDGLNSAGADSSAPATGDITTANANDLIVLMSACLSDYTGDPPTGYTALTARTVNIQQRNDYQIVSATGTYSGAWTIPGGDLWEALIVAFQASAAGGWGIGLSETRNRLIVTE